MRRSGCTMLLFHESEAVAGRVPRCGIRRRSRQPPKYIRRSRHGEAFHPDHVLRSAGGQFQSGEAERGRGRSAEIRREEEPDVRRDPEKIGASRAFRRAANPVRARSDEAGDEEMGEAARARLRFCHQESALALNVLLPTACVGRPVEKAEMSKIAAVRAALAARTSASVARSYFSF